MQSAEQELERLKTLARASSEALAATYVVNQELLRFLRKLHNRATGDDPLQEGYQTRIDPDILEELELIVADETRPD